MRFLRIPAILAALSIVMCADCAAADAPATTTGATQPAEARLLQVWLKRAYDDLARAPGRDDPIMGMFILADYYGELGDADGIRKVIAYVDAHKQELWSVQRWPDEDPRFCKLPIASLRVKDRQAYEQSMELLCSTLKSRVQNADLVWRDLVHVYGMGGDVGQAIKVSENIREKSWISEGLSWAAYAADRNGYQSAAWTLRTAAEDEANRHPDPYNHGTRPMISRLISDGNFAPAKTLLKESDWYWGCIGLCEVARGQYASGDKDGYRQTLAEAIEVARQVTDNEPRMRKQIWVDIAESQWTAGDLAGARESLAQAKKEIEPAEPFYRFDGFFYVAGWMARAGDTPGALALLSEAEQVAKDDNRTLTDETFFASPYRYVFLGLADAGDMDTAERLLEKIKGLEGASELNAAFAAGYATAGRTDKAAAYLAKVPRFGDEARKKGFIGGLFDTVSRPVSLSQNEHALAVRRTAFNLAKAGCWDALPAWIDALPSQGDRGLAALGVAEFLLRGRFADYDPI